MKTKVIAGVITLLFLASMLSMTFVPKAMAHTEEDPFVTDLIAGGGNPKSAITVGDVKVWNDAEYLYVKYVITDTDWCLTETHLHIAAFAEGIPQKNGNPPPGQFDYQMEHDCVTEYTYAIPLTLSSDNQLYIAAHAVVCKPREGEGEWMFAQGVLTTVTLWAGQHIDSGTVTVAIEGENLVVTYETKDGWELIETQLYVGTTPPSTAAPGQFPYKHSPLDPPVTTDQYSIPLSDFGVGCDDTLYLAAHATVQKDLGGGQYQTETGWGEGEQIDGGWAMYFSVTVTCECVPPEPPICETAWADGVDFPGKNWATYFTYTVQGWNVEGEWVIRVYYGGTYDHDFVFSAVQSGGEFTGTGGYPATGPPYTYTETVGGTVTGNTIDFVSTYNTGYWWHAVGTIAPDGTMSGTWTSSAGQEGTWQSISGQAVWE